MESIVKDKELSDYRKDTLLKKIKDITDENILGDVYYFLMTYLEE